MTSLHSHLSHPKYRPDIDGLRAVAVLAVVIFHAFPNWMKGGFIGVDIFFVISGFLISTIIFENLDNGTFSFSEFYARRIKRIFPALLLILIASYVFGWFALLADEYKQLGRHVAGGAGFVSNFILWNEAGYFDDSAETKPLLHLWSLGIEEQFYIVWPLMLWLAWRQKFNLLTITALVACVSFILNMKGVGNDSTAAFYSPQTRFWELLCGGSLAWMVLYKKEACETAKLKLGGWLASFLYRDKTDSDGRHLSNALSFAGVLLLAYGFWRIDKNLSFPGKWAIVPVLGAVLIILAGPKTWINRSILSSKFVVWFGLISYPLYLWHWPLLSFARIIESEVPSSRIRLAAIALSIALAWLTYKLVERRIRLGGHSGVKVFSLLVLMAVVGYVGYDTYGRDGLPFRQVVKNSSSLSVQFAKWDFRTNENCPDAFSGESLKFLTFCIANKKVYDVVLFGDSHANQLYPGLVAAIGKDHGILSVGNGPPLFSTKISFTNKTDHPWLSGDKSYDLVLDFILKSENIKTVVVASMWDAVINGDFLNENGSRRLGKIILSDGSENRSNADIFRDRFSQTVNLLVSRHKNVVLVIDTPEILINPKKCMRSGMSFNCSFNKDVILKRQSESRKFFTELQKNYPGIKIFDPMDLMCPDNICRWQENGTLVYRDYSHISEHQSLILGHRLGSLIASHD